MALNRIDLGRCAANGLRRGMTTGTCATAAVKSAAIGLLTGRCPSEVEVMLPEGHGVLPVTIQSATVDGEEAEAIVQKDAGDDPDQTHRAHIGARVRLNATGAIAFHAGAGVGIVRRRGLAIPPGEPAINPVPRRMIADALQEVVADYAHRLTRQPHTSVGADITIFCPEGLVISRKTFNPRLGIEGGISILGTTGIVEPMSLAAWIASVEIEINVALAESQGLVVLCPGNIGRRYFRDRGGLEDVQIVQVSNFLGRALDHLCRRMDETGSDLKRLVLAGHPGKLLKPLHDEWDTHSSCSAPPLDVLLELCRRRSIEPSLITQLAAQTSVEAVADLLLLAGQARAVFDQAAMRLAVKVQERVQHRCQVDVALFSITSAILGVTSEDLIRP